VSRVGINRSSTGIPTSCQWGCGAQVLAFRSDDDIGPHHTQVDTTNVVITADLTHPDIRDRLWEYHGPRIGWVHLHAGEGGVARSHWPLRIEHDCPDTPAHLHPPRGAGEPAGGPV
jgi:hypothetical protein